MGPFRLLKTGIPVAFSLAAGLAAALAAGPPAPEGRLLFQGRETASDAAEIAGIRQSGLSCAGCHGRDGAGGVFGAMVVPPIDGASLAAPTPTRPSYDRQRFARALREGVSGDERAFSPGMPRFDLAPAEIGALWDFLQGLPAEERRGVSPSAVRFALPALPSDEAAAQRLRAAVERAWAALDTPAVNGRKLRFDVVRIDETLDVLDGAFAVLAAGPGRRGEGDPLVALSDRGIPVIGPRRSPGAGEDRLPGVVWLTAGEAAIQRMLETENDGAVLVRRPEDFARAARAGPGERVLVSSFAVAAAADLDRLHETRGDVVLLRPAGDLADPDALAAALVLVLRDALAAAGRDLTRTGFLRAVAGVRVSPPAWTPLDYSLFPATGTDAVERLDLSPMPEARRDTAR